MTIIGIGAIISIVFFAEIIEIVFNKCEAIAFYEIIGIIVAWTMALLVSLDFVGFNIFNLFLREQLPQQVFVVLY